MLSPANLASPRSPAIDPTTPYPATLLERLVVLRDHVATEAAAVAAAGVALGPQAAMAAQRAADCTGCVIVTGVGKAGLIGQKLVATLASSGTPAHFLHPSEAVHGDLGRVRRDDLVWALSNSGRSEEVVRIANRLAEQSSGLIALTATDDNPLAVAADVTVTFGKHAEACPNGLAPTSSTAAMLAVGDAIAMLASRLRNFQPHDFARFHPGGSLGQKLTDVESVMRRIDHCRIANQDVTIRDAMVATSRTGRRVGALMLVDEAGKLAGVFTDSDLARLLEHRDDEALDRRISQSMTTQPKTLASGSMLSEAMAVFAESKISELPIVDDAGRPLGMLDVTDVVGLAEPVPSPAVISFGNRPG